LRSKGLIVKQSIKNKNVIKDNFTATQKNTDLLGATGGLTQNSNNLNSIDQTQKISSTAEKLRESNAVRAAKSKNRHNNAAFT